jgi:AcrR family transcriptional regulator
MNETEKLIIEKAKNRFERFGYKKTTMDEISKDCRISKKTLYAYFKGKENLFRYLLLDESHKATEEIFAQINGVTDPVEQLKKLVKTAVEYYNQDQLITRILKDEEALYATVLNKEYRQEVEEALIPSIAEIIRQGKKCGKIRDTDVNIAAYIGLKLFQAFSYMRTRDFDQEMKTPGYAVEMLLDQLMYGLIRNH